mmetsp:Transcript_17437/g.27843  ORF Transcript_17437/g.27843 Transcript_17437/m.27843 type:complete len:231 (+) Transcript_17437:614-1306(+)
MTALGFHPSFGCCSPRLHFPVVVQENCSSPSVLVAAASENPVHSDSILHCYLDCWHTDCSIHPADLHTDWVVHSTSLAVAVRHRLLREPGYSAYCTIDSDPLRYPFHNLTLYLPTHPAPPVAAIAAGLAVAHCSMLRLLHCCHCTDYYSHYPLEDCSSRLDCNCYCCHTAAAALAADSDSEAVVRSPNLLLAALAVAAAVVAAVLAAGSAPFASSSSFCRPSFCRFRLQS